MEKVTKKPSQLRSQLRMKKALESATILLETMPLEEISIPEIAKHSDVPRSSIYQFFPNMTALLTELAQQNMRVLLDIFEDKIQSYLQMPTLEILKDLISMASDFYNKNHVASLLILNGVMNSETYKSQQTTIQIMAKSVTYLIQNSSHPIQLPDDGTVIEHLVEVTFSLMKYSYFKHGEITNEIQKDIFDLCKLYLIYKKYIQAD